MTTTRSTFALSVILAIATCLISVGLWAQETSPPNGPISPSSTAPQRPGAGSAATGVTAGAADPATDGAPSAQDTTPTLPGGRQLASLLGMTLEAATEAFGAPKEVFPVRGREAWEDDVVFYYRDHTYLFWFRDRVWQVRVDRRFVGKVIGGVSMGDSRSAVEQILGSPFHVGQDSEIFLLPDRGFPVRARLFFTDDHLSDLYVYRGDF